MRKLTVKNIIDFRSLSSRSQKTFVNNLKSNFETGKADSGGNYWQSSLSALGNSFKLNQSNLINGKILELEGKYKRTDYKRTKDMYGRNIDVLSKYVIFDFNEWKPPVKLTYLKKHKSDFELTINGIELKTTPDHVYSFPNKNVDEIGAIWFIAKLDGYRTVELGLFAEVLFKNLEKIFNNNYVINPKYCIVVEVVKNMSVNYSQIQSGEVGSLLNGSIGELKKMI